MESLLPCGIAKQGATRGEVYSVSKVLIGLLSALP